MIRTDDRIMGLIFRAPEKWLHIREMARALKISPNTVRKNIAVLKKRGIVAEKREGNMIMFRANMESESYKREKRLHNLRSVYESGVVDYLFDHYSPGAIVLFGSYTRGEDISTSDVDIGIVTSSKNMPDLTRFEKRISRRIQLSLFTREEVSVEFFSSIINGVVLKGMLRAGKA